mmetsp:Transcript_32710/g.105668  ORF Transcript_32710/g.105668 Transcript_32710/m.105668 type:complete len:344 (-) Transcript_32710:24-1055(-)|eukprot:scaffold33345_cov123-Isochrysis_galbana.AAC.10
MSPLASERRVVVALLDDAVGHPNHDRVQPHEERREGRLEHGPRSREMAPRPGDQKVAKHVRRPQKVMTVEHVVEQRARHVGRVEEIVEHLRPHVLRLVRLGLVLPHEAGRVHVGREGDVQRHARVGVLVAQDVDEALAGRLGGRVRGIPDERGSSHHGAHGRKVGCGRQVGGSSLGHARQQGSRGVDDAVIVDAHHQLVVLVVQLLKVLWERRSGRSDAHVHGTQLRLGRGNRGVQRGPVAYVCSEDADGGLGGGSQHLGPSILQLGSRARDQRHPRASRGGQLGQLKPDALGAAGDEHVLARDGLARAPEHAEAQQQRQRNCGRYADRDPHQRLRRRQSRPR